MGVLSVGPKGLHLTSGDEVMIINHRVFGTHESLDNIWQLIGIPQKVGNCTTLYALAPTETSPFYCSGPCLCLFIYINFMGPPLT